MGFANDVHSHYYSHKISAIRNEFTIFADFKLKKNSFGIVLNHFYINARTVPEELQMDIIDIKCDSVLTDKFSSVDTGTLYTFTRQKYPISTAFPSRILSLLATSYLKTDRCLFDFFLNVSTAHTLTPHFERLIRAKSCQTSGTTNC
ncbi:General transcription factor II-I repeat domain-containing protein 2B [Thelohanellus kitauei]|uniref:General transcription factor II-I repeat domain-containing protein 2B n=1 Tax=Thelohanellus kitauei TaxID=669202 RepID=A0A0C2MVS6_THEKT|nr:General transcription factor II-I repeat domain-containing protein 2B [Thelohanellus kitauei]